MCCHTLRWWLKHYIGKESISVPFHEMGKLFSFPYTVALYPIHFIWITLCIPIFSSFLERFHDDWSVCFHVAFYSTSWEIESIEILTILSIRWCAREINSYKVVLFTPYPVAKLFESQEGYVTSTEWSAWICVRFFASCGKRIIKFESSRIVCRGNRK